MAEQLSLFEAENIAYNKTLQRLADLDFAGALKAFRLYMKLFPSGRDVTFAMEQASFLNERLGQASWSDIELGEAERRYQIWMEFEDKFGWPLKEGAFEERLQVQYFAKLADGLAGGEHSQASELPGGIPLGFIYLLAHRPNQAISSLQGLIAERANIGKAYGYLGDAHCLQGDMHKARLCYREAFVMAPYDVDLRRLQDREIRARVEELQEDEEIERHSLAWFASIGQLDGIFESRDFRDLDTLKRWVDRYLDLFRVYQRQEDRALIPELFYSAMVLSDNARMLQSTGEVSLVEIRRQMKEWHPALFARHMRLLELREQRER